MVKENTKKGMTKAEIHAKLEKFKTQTEKIKYLQSIEPRIMLANESTRKAYYGALADLSRKKGDANKTAEYLYKAGDEVAARRALEILGDAEMMVYKNPARARAYYNMANASKKERSTIRKSEHSLENTLNAVIAFGAFFCSFIFLSKGITGNAVLDASTKTSNILGALLFIIGVVASFVYFERRK